MHPLPVICTTTGPSEFADAVFHVIGVLTLINHHAPLGLPNHPTSSRKSPGLELACVGAAVTPSLAAGAMLPVASPLAFVLLESASVNATAVALAIANLSDVHGTVSIVHGLLVRIVPPARANVSRTSFRIPSDLRHLLSNNSTRQPRIARRQRLSCRRAHGPGADEEATIGVIVHQPLSTDRGDAHRPMHIRGVSNLLLLATTSPLRHVPHAG
eukprot:CAMPEP_0180515806 /NCGR_PEP_ID=MMETSP1036_2-20121128/53540_1 /TAXON_ID=632150 /ORGANISM="Azadinium spinosum, Strain 3D9" /LENGTH=213 /DNA_ID=CAMNT_0022527481 /DNA_START=142 /DNA_END=780 /DNA_ORIENTATION=+